jgi:hypothetical protein
VRKSRFSEDQIIAILKESEAKVETGRAVPAVPGPLAPRPHPRC